MRLRCASILLAWCAALVSMLGTADGRKMWFGNPIPLRCVIATPPPAFHQDIVGNHRRQSAQYQDSPLPILSLGSAVARRHTPCSARCPSAAVRLRLYGRGGVGSGTSGIASEPAGTSANVMATRHHEGVGIGYEPSGSTPSGNAGNPPPAEKAGAPPG